ncbi:putative aldo-keto reductase [Phaeomoniella chlamydospora]|uniref:D-xylose reductase [NAD(P)H] n=1 Tax=Phaeomoniella chlamydospora TaxID=158046 RepID=A0A0G2EYP8_PHACM|nr:putative aldo-keto reductase [Phaeomoniella chlamydospora]
MSPKYSLTDTFPLPNTTIRIPQLGFGVYRSNPSQTVESCLTALRVGYRHIDTAQFYGNETQVGEAIAKSGIPRSELFITTKILSAGGSVEKSYEKCVESVNKISNGEEGGYVDLFLVHSPNSGAMKRKEMWLALEKLYQERKVKSLGVSNYGIKHIEEMKEYATIWPPHVNQIEVSSSISTPLSKKPPFHTTDPNPLPLKLHPWNQQPEITSYCAQNNILISAYCPLVRQYKANDETLVSLAKKYNVSTNQILVRYCLQKDWIPLPKSDNPERIKLNADVYGFEIEEEDMRVLNGLDQGAAGAVVQVVDNY